MASIVALGAMLLVTARAESDDATEAARAASNSIGVGAEEGPLGVQGSGRPPARSGRPGARGEIDAGPDADAYGTFVREEAARSSPEVRADMNDVTALVDDDEVGDPGPGPAGKDRIDALKTAVDEALAAMPPAEAGESLAEELEMTVDGSPASRRERLRDLVESTPTPEGLVDDSYVQELRKEVSETLVVGAAEPGEQALGDREADQRRASPDTYRVRRGDSLWGIAKSQLGSGYRWPAIYAANRGALKDADVLEVGQLLTIPAR